MHRTSTILIASLLLPACEGPTGAPDSGIDQVEYDVMSAAISVALEKEPFAGTIEPGEEPQPIERVVIIAQPDPEAPVVLGLVQVQAGPPMDHTSLEDYARKTGRPAFENRFNGIGRYELLPMDEMTAIFAAEGWRGFYKRFPGAAGFFALSRVGVSRDGDEAIVHVLSLRAGTWGYTSSMLFRKQADRWILAGETSHSQM